MKPTRKGRIRVPLQFGPSHSISIRFSTASARRRPEAEHVDLKGAAQRSLIALYQTNKRFEHFWSEFHHLAQKAGMEPATTLEYLKDRLSTEIKAQLVTVNDKKMDLNKFVKVVQNIATKLEILNKTSFFSRKSYEFNATYHRCQAFLLLSNLLGTGHTDYN
ncbi:hypothetical protein MMC07_008671 [Pseudocyphellaria aurata]|nr:hypothetical protein [Pseudocyphellaria aurata]